MMRGKEEDERNLVGAVEELEKVCREKEFCFPKILITTDNTYDAFCVSGALFISKYSDIEKTVKKIINAISAL
jgi:hypothetical protein